MSNDLLQAVQDYVAANIGYFHERRLETVKSKRLNDVLKRKNPYLFRAKSQTVIQLVYGIMDAFLSSQEEGLFGTFLEGVAVFVAGEVYDGYKPEKGKLRGIDLVLEKNSKLYILEIKSGPNWGNSSQVQRMLTNFSDAITVLQTKYPTMEIIPINGCMYGKERSPLKTGTIKRAGRPDESVRYWKLCGQDFWHFISDNRDLYTDIIEPLGFEAKERNGEFLEAYDNFINNLVFEFLTKYRNADGSVAWDRLTEFVSKSEAEDKIRDLVSNR
ncbi:MAG: PmeII family type II restriction endonuclease [Chloroflexi bacterium]|nr:PmeII family type II restriction endonuclease [Chloroflexota bacterium]